MKITSSFLYFLIVISLLITSCTTQATPFPTVEDIENAVIIPPTATQTQVMVPTSVPTELSTPDTATPMPTPTDVFSLIGTVLPNRSETISLSNFKNLKRVGVWGRGSIQAVRFSPDGHYFIAVSEMGWTIYNMRTLDQSPQWVSFNEPVLFDNLYFSNDGSLVNFDVTNDSPIKGQARSFPSGELQTNISGIEWVKPDLKTEHSDVVATSPDKTKLFRSDLKYEFNEELFSEDKSIREMYDTNGNLLYTLRDDASYVKYSDRNGPEGCDLSVFSPCGNALMALATTPVKVLFSSDSKTFSALYEPTGLYSGRMRDFSYIRMYNSADGKFLGSLGGFTNPVQDFDYSPGGKFLLTGFVDGTILLWNIESQSSAFGARHMNAPIGQVMFSNDSKYLLIQRGDELEIRLTSDGSLRSKFETAAFALSPVGNLIALGDFEGNIQIRDIDTGVGLRKIEAHKDRIYSLAFSPDGQLLASSAQDCNIKLWDVATGKFQHYFEETRVSPYEFDMVSRTYSTYLEFVPDKNMLIGFGSWGTVVNWNVNSGATNYVIQSDALEYYDGMITLKPHFPEYFGTEETKDIFYINENSFDINTGENKGVYQPPTSTPDGCASVGPLSQDKNILFTRGYKDHEGEICVLNAQTMELLNTISVMQSDYKSLQWVDWPFVSPDGKQLIVTGGSGFVYVYQIIP
ncbi:MAG: WD40 repeat domain-containing protein [Anaerolineales bacterium]